MNNAEYWARRFKIMEDSIKDQAYDYAVNLEEQFDRAIAQIDTQMRAWYQRFADNNGISWAEAQRLLTTDELKEFRWTVQEYIKYGKEHAITGAWAKELENASARVHISRLDSLKVQLRQQAEALTEARIKATTDASVLSYTESYYHTAYEVQRGLGVGWTMQAINRGEVEKLLSRPWTVDNQTFRARCWTDKTKLVETVNQELTRMIATGEAPDKAIAAIAKRFNVSKQNAGRVVMTESAYFSSAAQKDCFNDLGVEQYKVVATLDSSTCETCGDFDSKVFKMSEYQVGATAPPFHPWCRCCTAPYFEDMEGMGERYSRDPVTGERKMVPGNMTYKEWAKQFVVDETKINQNQQNPLTTPANGGKIKKADIQFTPADTIEEADAYLKQFGVSGEYAKGKINLDVANTINKTVAEYNSVFGNKIKLRSIRKWPKRDAEFVAAYSPVFGDVFLYKCGSKTALSELLKDAIEEHSLGAWSTAAQEHFIRHELGHALHSGVGRDATKDALTALFNGAKSKLSWGKCGGYSLAAYKKAGLTVDDFKADIRAAGDILSAYGFTSVEEMVAESVAEYMTGQPRDFATKVVNTLMGW